MKLPWVSRRAYELQETLITFLQKDRDAIALQRDRLADQLLSRIGYEPVSAPVRAEVATAQEQVERAASVLHEDDSSGMLAPEILEMADELGAPV